MTTKQKHCPGVRSRRTLRLATLAAQLAALTKRVDELDDYIAYQQGRAVARALRQRYELTVACSIVCLMARPPFRIPDRARLGSESFQVLAADEPIAAELLGRELATGDELADMTAGDA